MGDAQQMSLGWRLKRERESHYWTQAQLAAKTGGSVPSINRWEHDRVRPRQDMLNLLTEVFGRPPERWGTERSLLWNVPFLRNPYFTGRDQTLLRLHQALSADKVIAASQIRVLSGLGGIGKTQTAIEYAYRYANEYEAVLWVRADSREALISDFASLAMTLALPEKEEVDQFLVGTAVKRWLQEHGPWLLIFDNADELAMVSDFLPRRAGGAVVLTTRSQITGLHIKKISMEKMSQEEAVAFLLQRDTSSGDKDGAEIPARSVSDREWCAAQKLWEVMDGLPLALDQARAYTEARQCSLSDYVDLYRNHRNVLLRERGEPVPEHPDAVANTLSLSFQRVEQKNRVAAELLRLCAFFSPDAIPKELITIGSTYFTTSLQSQTPSALLLNDAISTLRTYSLVQRDPTTLMLSMHRLVQAVLLDELEETEMRTWRARSILTVNAAFPHPEHSTWPLCEQLLPHALLAAQEIERQHIISEEAGHLLHETATYLQDRARYQEAGPLYQQALHIREQQLGPEHPDVATSLNGLGNLYQRQGKYAEAEPLYQRALHIWGQQSGPEHPEVATSLNGLGNLYREQGKYAEAEPLFQRAVRLREQQLEPDHPLIAYPLNNLAILYFEQGKYGEAGQLFQRALQIWERHLEPEHPLVAYSLNNLGETYRKQGKYSEAGQLYQRTLDIWGQQSGSEHPLAAYSLNGLANLYFEQGKCAQAEPLYLRALQIWELQETQHPEMAAVIHDLAIFYETQHRQQEALSLYRRALAIRERAFGPAHPKTQETQEHLTILLRAMDCDALSPLLEISSREQEA